MRKKILTLKVVELCLLFASLIALSICFICNSTLGIYISAFFGCFITIESLVIENIIYKLYFLEEIDN